MSIQSGAAVAFVAALGANLGKVCQKRGTKDLPELEMKAAIVKRYLSSPWWVVGLVLDVGGAIMTLLALAMAPVSVVQPILGCGLAFVAIFSHYLTADRLQLRDWGACALCVAGTVGIGLTTVEPSGLEAVSPARGALLVAAFGAAAAGCSAAAARGRLPTELAASVSAGLCFGLSACSTRCGLAAAAAAAAAAGPAARLAPLAGALGVVLSVALSSTGFVQQVRPPPALGPRPPPPLVLSGHAASLPPY